MAAFDDLPDCAFLRERQLLDGLVPFSSATLWRRVRSGQFPAPMHLIDGRVTVWRVSAIRAWLQTQAVGSTAPSPSQRHNRKGR